MRKFIAAILVLFMVSGAAATTVQNEEVRIDLSNSQIHVDLYVEELTSSRLTYFVNHPVSNFEAKSNGETLDCEVDTGQIESKISCEPSQQRNFHVYMNFTAANLVDNRETANVFQYSKNFIRPTDNYSLQVLLPEGTGVLDRGNISSPVISPEDGDIGSNGRRITVEWKKNPTVGDRISFQVIYEKLSNQVDYTKIVAAIIFTILAGIVGFILFRRFMREDIKTIYEDLEEDEVQVLEILRENDGEMLQKDVVNSMDYSKAKISGIVSNLVEEDIVVKEKEGRSNKLSLSRHYRS